MAGVVGVGATLIGNCLGPGAGTTGGSASRLIGIVVDALGGTSVLAAPATGTGKEGVTGAEAADGVAGVLVGDTALGAGLMGGSATCSSRATAAGATLGFSSVAT